MISDEEREQLKAEIREEMSRTYGAALTELQKLTRFRRRIEADGADLPKRKNVFLGTTMKLLGTGRIEDSEGNRWDTDGITLVGGVNGNTLTFVDSAGNVLGVIQARGNTFFPDDISIVIEGPGDYNVRVQENGVSLSWGFNDPATAGPPAAFHVSEYGWEFSGSNTLPESAAVFGGGQRVIFIENRETAPSSNPSGGGFLYTEGGALIYRGSGGTVTTVANA